MFHLYLIFILSLFVLLCSGRSWFPNPSFLGLKTQIKSGKSQRGHVLSQELLCLRVNSSRQFCITKINELKTLISSLNPDSSPTAEVRGWVQRQILDLEIPRGLSFIPPQVCAGENRRPHKVSEHKNKVSFGSKSHPCHGPSVTWLGAGSEQPFCQGLTCGSVPRQCPGEINNTD